MLMFLLTLYCIKIKASPFRVYNTENKQTSSLCLLFNVLQAKREVGSIFWPEKELEYTFCFSTAVTNFNLASLNSGIKAKV